MVPSGEKERNWNRTLFISGLFHRRVNQEGDEQEEEEGDEEEKEEEEAIANVSLGLPPL